MTKRLASTPPAAAVQRQRTVDILINCARSRRTVARMPLSIAITDQSDREAVFAALSAELNGGPPTGFEPALENGALTVAFHNLVVHGTRG